MVLSEIQKMEIITKYNGSLTMKQIATDMKINIKTVSKWINKYHVDKNIIRKRGTGLYKRINL